MVDAAGTLCKAAEALKEQGAVKVLAYCTHAVLSGSAVARIAQSEIDELVVTDTIPLSPEAAACARIRQISIAELMAACRRFLERAPRDFITIEYVMLAGVNDTPGHARQLIELTREVPCKFNLIPFNPFPDSGYEKPRADAMRVFREILQDAGYVVTTRKTRGDDIDAACGQLAGKVADKSGRVMKRMHKEAA